MISVENKTISDILKGSDNSFVIPNYQRSYDWGKSELQELLEDLSSISAKDKDQLFLGSFIFDVSEGNVIKIVDGQQRLTTISIALVALHNHAKKINEFNDAAEISLFVTNSSGIFGNQNVKIKVAENIRDVYNYISSKDWKGDWPVLIGKKSVKRQINKIKPIYNQISDYIKDYGVDKLRTFAKALLTSYVIVIKVSDDQDVFAVFERVNARGLDLNIGDLLKNYIFSHGIEDHESKWGEIVENANGNLPRMLKYFWVSRNGYILQSALYRELKAWTSGLTTPDGFSSNMDFFITELLDFSRYYHATQQIEKERWRDWLKLAGINSIAENDDYYLRIWRVLKALKLFRITQAYPLLYTVLRKYKEGSINEKLLFRVFETLERYHFVNNIVAGRVGNEVEKFYADSSKKIWGSDQPAVLINDFLNDLRKKRASYEEFEANFADALEYTGKNLGLISYFYDRLNNFDFSKKEFVKGGQYMELFSPEKVGVKRNFNVEHILPQSFKGNYPSEVDREKIDDIGNLLVISRHTNSDFGNKNPAEKLEMMESDVKHYNTLRYMKDFLHEYSSDLVNWDIAAIDNRSLALSSKSYKGVWNF